MEGAGDGDGGRENGWTEGRQIEGMEVNGGWMEDEGARENGWTQGRWMKRGRMNEGRMTREKMDG